MPKSAPIETARKPASATLDRPQTAWKAARLVSLAVIALVVLVRVRLSPAPLERDEGEYAYAGQLILQGIPPFVEIYNMKMPGIYAAYAAMMAVLGQTAISIRMGLLLVNLACTAFVFLLARRATDRESAALTAATYALLSTGFGVLGVFAHATHFVVLFALAGFLMLPPSDKPVRPMQFFLAGLCFGTAFMMKQHGAAFIVLGGLYALWRCWPAAGTSKGGRVLALFLFSCAVFVPFVLTCLIMWRAGAFGKFWFWTFDYARAYVSQAGIGKVFRNFLLGFKDVGWRWGAGVLWLYAIVGLLTLYREGRKAVWIAGLFVAGLIGVCPGFFFRAHYFVLMLPSVALLAVFGAKRIAALAPKRWAERGGGLMPILVLGAGWLFAIAIQAPLFFAQTPAQVSRTIYSVNPFPESVEIARYLREHTKPDDRIGILGSEPQVCFYAKRKSATPFVYMYPLMEEQHFAPAMQDELIRDLESAPPAYIVYFPMVHSWMVKKNSEMRLPLWIPGYLKARYTKVGLIEIEESQTRYYWDDQQKGREPSTRFFVIVCKRKDL